jgi:hypothetical protein
MHVDVLSVLSLFSAAPFVLIAAILCFYLIRRLRWVRSTRSGRRLFGIQPSAVGLGMAFLFLQAFWRPSLSHAIEVRQKVDVEEDDAGDPEHLTKQLNRQLKRIRRGERVDQLVLRL